MIILLDLPHEKELASILAGMSEDAVDFLTEAVEQESSYGCICDDDESMALIDEINEVAQKEGYDPFILKNPVTIH